MSGLGETMSFPEFVKNMMEWMLKTENRLAKLEQTVADVISRAETHNIILMTTLMGLQEGYSPAFAGVLAVLKNNSDNPMLSPRTREELQALVDGLEGITPDRPLHLSLIRGGKE